MSNTALSNVTDTNATSAAALSEDWLAVWIGLLIFVLALVGIGKFDLLGWSVSTSIWTNLSVALGASAKAYAGFGGIAALIATYIALLIVLSIGAVALKIQVKRFAIAFTVVFALAYASWIIGNYAHFAAVTPTEFKKFGIDWSLRLTNEGGYIFALISGLIIGNFFPGFAQWLKEAIR